MTSEELNPIGEPIGDVTVTLHRARELRHPRTQVRFTVSSPGNHKRLARGTEGYNNLADAAAAATLVVGSFVTPTLGRQVILRSPL